MVHEQIDCAGSAALGGAYASGVEPALVPALNATDLQLRAPRRARVLIAEDHPVMRDGLIDLLAQEPDLQLIGCADCAFQAEKLVFEIDPDILVLDLTLGCDDGVALAQRLLKDRPKLRIVVLSMHDELVFADRLLAMGVLAYVTKDRTSEEFLLAMRSALHGQVYVTAEQRERLNSRLCTSEVMSPDEILSARELSVLRLLASGKNAAAIAAELSVATKTIYSHRRNISAKLGITSCREMMRYAFHWARRAD